MRLQSINMKRFDKWLFLKNLNTEIKVHIHVKNGYFVYDRNYKQQKQMTPVEAAIKIQRIFKKYQKKK